jgi:hypothetical protein
MCYRQKRKIFLGNSQQNKKKLKIFFVHFVAACQKQKYNRFFLSCERLFCGEKISL